jgi:hypothetical protein
MGVKTSFRTMDDGAVETTRTIIWGIKVDPMHALVVSALYWLVGVAVIGWVARRASRRVGATRSETTSL